ncbi:DJ-1/PfpI family protein [Roseibium alexandrii]|uniref:Transcriptional regulator n=1 Tax=Roseibium alexandrii (strain DSM 17067 / NCIMB 14079 / DFL-11) TaxID=244592 RepID=A0A5E8GY38_ROSAD|nr:DJ-1/PfpI family protein [Roseibium alexandrii]EEE44925.2 Transcriptional regulator [Roseibium alexandrii DFL-11]
MTLSFGILIFPNVQLLDVAGPNDAFAAVPGAKVHLIWKNRDLVTTTSGMEIHANTTFSECPKLDVLCIPGGGGVNPLLRDDEVLEFVRRAAASARYVTSVCTGSLVLGRAGLLNGKRATSHWNAVDFLPQLGAIPVQERVVKDGTLYTAGGITSGIDFGLEILADLLGKEEAKTVQLALEYAPAPPFSSGTPEDAAPEIIAEARRRMAHSRQERLALFGAPV